MDKCVAEDAAAARLSEAFLSAPLPSGSAAPRLSPSRPHGYPANSQLKPRGRAGARAAARGRGGGGTGGGAGTAAPGKLGRGCVHTHSRTHTHAHTHSCTPGAAAMQWPCAKRRASCARARPADCGTARPPPAAGRERGRAARDAHSRVGGRLWMREFLLVPAPALRLLPSSRSWGRSLPLPHPRKGELFGKRISAFICLKYRLACQTEDWVGDADTESTRSAAAAGAQPLSGQPERVGGDRSRRGSSAQGLRVPQISAGHSHPSGDGAWKRGRGRTGKNRSHRHLPAPSRLWGAQPLGLRALHRFPQTGGLHPPPRPSL